MSPKILAATAAEISCNCRVKHYPNGSKNISCFSADIIRVPGWEASSPDRRSRSGEDAKGNAFDNLMRSKRRARTALSDIALSNEFKYFVTLTLDKTKVDRYDEKEVVRKLNYWLDNNVRRRGLAYVLVPELHKDGAIHFHGFFNDALPVVDSGTLSTGKGKPKKPRSHAQRLRWISDGAHIVYNLPNWSLGFSTAIELYGNYSAAVGYVCKYISKAPDKVGGRWYYSGGALCRPEVTYHKVDYDYLLGIYNDRVQPFAVDALNCMGFAVYTNGDDEYVFELDRFADGFRRILRG